MKQLPESLLYGTRFMFLVAITLMTPLCTLASDVLSQKLTTFGNYIIITSVIDSILFVMGWKLLLLNHKYIVEKEAEYGINS